jgi:DNA polymerase-3 subunit epsilon
VTTQLVYLDTETTGLDPARHEVWEVAWAVDDGDIVNRFLPHTLRTADAQALELNGYYRRSPLGEPWSGTDIELRQVLTGATVVGSNPAFDTAFLRARWGVAPWHHRTIAVESVALGIYGWDRPKGLKDVTAALRADGFDIPEPDHTAAGDVATLRAAYEALRKVGQ